MRFEPTAAREPIGYPVLDEWLAALFPPGAVLARLTGHGDPAVLSRRERDCTGSFGAKRLSEFAAGRACARMVLERLGIVGHDLTIEADRRPRWPVDIVGSITHTNGFCAAVGARRDAIRAIGIDAERRGRVGVELWPSLFVPNERRILDALDATAADRFATFFFSAKEAFYKCRFALATDWLDFTDVEIDFDATTHEQSGPFEARLVADRSSLPRELSGRFAFDGDVVWSGVSVET